MRRKRHIIEEEVQTPKKSAKLSAEDLLNKSMKAQIMFTLCDIMGVLGRDLAHEVGVTKAQISHYRQGHTDIPASRMVLMIGALREAIKGSEEQLKTFEKKLISKSTNPKLAKLAAQHLSSRIDLAKEILDINTARINEDDNKPVRRKKVKK